MHRHIPTIHRESYHRNRVMSMVATHLAEPERGTPSGIRTRDLHLERVTSWAARLWGQRREGAIASKTLSSPLQLATAHLRNDSSSQQK